MSIYVVLSRFVHKLQLFNAVSFGIQLVHGIWTSGIIKKIVTVLFQCVLQAKDDWTLHTCDLFMLSVVAIRSYGISHHCV